MKIGLITEICSELIVANKPIKSCQLPFILIFSYVNAEHVCTLLGAFDLKVVVYRVVFQLMFLPILT